MREVRARVDSRMRLLNRTLALFFVSLVAPALDLAIEVHERIK